MTRIFALVFALFAGAAFAADARLELRPIANGLTHPVAITHAGDSRLFITLQEGQVRIYDGGRVLPTPFLDLGSIISTGGERGLLSIAFHPRYAENGLFFADYTDPNGDTVIARYQVSATDPNRANPSGTVLLRIAQPFPNHNGGQLQFGPDGYLYIGMGDGGSAGDPGNRAQNLGVLLGKILRIDVDHGTPYGIPSSNPFVNRPGARPEIWALGMRNPWRFSFDRSTGDLWIADVGQGSREEIDFQPATSIGGENYGWRLMEGFACYDPPSNCNPGNSLVPPIAEYGHTNQACSVTGGYRYRGSLYPRFQGIYFYGDYCNGVIEGLTQTAAGWSAKVLLDSNLAISTFGEDVNGELYVASYNGTIYAIADAEPLGPKRRSARH